MFHQWMATLSLVQFHDQVKRLTVFPFVAMMVAFLPLICVTSPSIHASSGSSTQTCDPTMMFPGVTWTNSKKERKGVIVNTHDRTPKKSGKDQQQQPTKTQKKTHFFLFFLQILTMMLLLPLNSSYHETQNGGLWN